MSQFQEFHPFFVEQEIREEEPHISFEESRNQGIYEETGNTIINNEQKRKQLIQNSSNKKISSSPKKYHIYKLDYKEKIVMEVSKIKIFNVINLLF
jgi:hypothetical protein